MSQYPDPDGFIDPAEGARLRAARAEAEAYVQQLRDEVAAGRYRPRSRKCWMCGEVLGERRFNGFCSRRCWDLREAELAEEDREREHEMWLVHRYGGGEMWRGVVDPPGYRHNPRRSPIPVGDPHPG